MIENANNDNIVKNQIIEIFIKEKLFDLLKKFNFDFYFTYRYIILQFFMNLNVENN